MDDERARDAASVDVGELPELTRGLRALGSVRRGGTSQTLFFGPLLEARRRAADSRAPATRVRAFSAKDLAVALDRAIERIVADWPDVRPAARRALKAELLDRVEPYSAALRRLGERADRVLTAGNEPGLDAWRAWTAQLAEVFAVADRTWMALRSVVEALPRPESGSARESQPGRPSGK